MSVISVPSVALVLLAKQLRLVGALRRRVLLGSPAEAVGDVQVPFRINRDLMRLPELAGLHAVGAPPVEPLAVLVELQQSRVGAVHDPHGAVVTEEDVVRLAEVRPDVDRKSTRLNSSHSQISYAVFCLKKKRK